MAKISRAEKAKRNRAKWAEREPPPRKKPMTREQMSALRRAAWEMGRRLGAEGPWSLPDINRAFVANLPSRPPTFSGRPVEEE